MTSPTRSEYTAGLRLLADLLDANPEVPLPYHGTDSEMTFYCDSKEQIVALTRAFPGRKDKSVRDWDSYGFVLSGSLAGLQYEARIDREEVCTAVVTGTKVVTRRTATAWTEEQVEEPEITWECSPLLDGQVPA